MLCNIIIDFNGDISSFSIYTHTHTIVDNDLNSLDSYS